MSMHDNLDTGTISKICPNMIYELDKLIVTFTNTKAAMSPGIPAVRMNSEECLRRRKSGN